MQEKSHEHIQLDCDNITRPENVRDFHMERFHVEVTNIFRTAKYCLLILFHGRLFLDIQPFFVSGYVLVHCFYVLKFICKNRVVNIISST